MLQSYVQFFKFNYCGFHWGQSGPQVGPWLKKITLGSYWLKLFTLAGHQEITKYYVFIDHSQPFIRMASLPLETMTAQLDYH